MHMDANLPNLARRAKAVRGQLKKSRSGGRGWQLVSPLFVVMMVRVVRVVMIGITVICGHGGQGDSIIPVSAGGHCHCA